MRKTLELTGTFVLLLCSGLVRHLGPCLTANAVPLPLLTCLLPEALEGRTLWAYTSPSLPPLAEGGTEVRDESRGRLHSSVVGKWVGTN